MLSYTTFACEYSLHKTVHRDDVLVRKSLVFFVYHWHHRKGDFSFFNSFVPTFMFISVWRCFVSRLLYIDYHTFLCLV